MFSDVADRSIPSIEILHHTVSPTDPMESERRLHLLNLTVGVNRENENPNVDENNPGGPNANANPAPRGLPAMLTRKYTLQFVY
jgi:hypothetical protein